MSLSNTVVKLPIEHLHPSPRNARTHSKKQIRALMRSIERFGFVNPVLVDGSNRIVAGHGRIEAARRLGLSEVPVVCIEGLSEAELRAYALADNKLAEQAGWDRKLVALEMDYISQLDIDVDLTVTGFEAVEIDVLLDELVVGDDDDEPEEPLDDLLAETARQPVSRRGDLWHLGDHRLLCGDARDEADLGRLMAGETARQVITDPPYNVPIDGHVSGLGAQRHREFAMASGEMSPVEFTAFLTSSLEAMTAQVVDGALLHVFMDWRHLQELLTASRRAHLELVNLVVWAKTNAGMGSLYRSQHELVLVLKSGRATHVNNVALGRHGRHRSNVWTYAGANSFGRARGRDLAMHPTVKPVAMIADALRDASNRGDVVLDPFAGSGTLLIAAESAGRRARTIEITPAYVDVAVRRWQALTGNAAMHATCGLAFDDLAIKRREAADAA